MNITYGEVLRDLYALKRMISHVVSSVEPHITMAADSEKKLSDIIEKIERKGRGRRGRNDA